MRRDIATAVDARATAATGVELQRLLKLEICSKRVELEIDLETRDLESEPHAVSVAILRAPCRMRSANPEVSDLHCTNLWVCRASHSRIRTVHRHRDETEEMPLVCSVVGSNGIPSRSKSRRSSSVCQHDLTTLFTANIVNVIV